MRLGIACMVSIAVIAGAVSAQGQKGKWVQPTQEGVGVYKSEIRTPYEQAIFTVDAKARMEVLATGKEHYKVKVDGQIGWVEKRLVATSAKGSKSYTFDDAEVVGYLDNPTPVYIIDADDQDRDPIKLERSFADALRENVDQETVERQTK